MPTKDRRIFPRKRVALNLECVSNNGTAHTESRGRVRLAVQDLSLGGLSAFVDQPIVKDSRVAVFFPRQHPCQGALTSGRVIGCEREGEHYRIRVEFDQFPSARGHMPYVDRRLPREFV